VALNEFPNGRNEKEYRKTHAKRQAQETERGETERGGGRERLCTVENTGLLSWIFNYIR
jgi:hypothetical protein